MDSIFWILISIAVLVVLFAVIFIFLVSKKKIKYREPDYYSIFLVGLIWFAIGIPLDNSALWVIGLILLIWGLVNKKKWEKNRVRWENLTKFEKKLRIWIMVVLGVLVLAGLIFLLLVEKGIL